MALRQVANERSRIFLTFDDGLDEIGTPKVLDVLLARNSRATFFLIAGKISQHEKLLTRILEEGHAIGNHSLDHGYRHFFSSQSRLQSWIEAAELEFVRFGVRSRLVGFRPPAGVITPKLREVLQLKREPLVMWNQRFYDTVLSWSAGRAVSAARKLEPGSIVLLHDRQSVNRIESFCKTLDAFIAQLSARGLNCESLTREICLRGGLC